MMPHLYELAEMRGIIDTWVEEQEGEWTPEVAELFDGLDVEADVKIERTGLAIRERKVYVDAVKQERDRLDGIVQRNARAVEGLTAYLHHCMRALNKVTVKGKLCTVAIQKNSQPTITCTIEAKDLPFALRREVLQVSLDRQAILEQWAQGVELPAGVQVEQGTHVRVR